MISRSFGLRATLLVSTILSSSLGISQVAQADGGKGGHSVPSSAASGGVNDTSSGGTGGAGDAGVADTSGASSTYGGGGGGGAGVTGGLGGDAAGVGGPSAGGGGGTLGSRNGLDGTNYLGSSGGGAGGGGGAFGHYGVAPAHSLTGRAQGGNGGRGGNGSVGDGSGGGGGAGGAGAVLETPSTRINFHIGASAADAFAGGHGGTGGAGEYGGAGGDGGHGVHFVGGQALGVNIVATVRGGNAGAGGQGQTANGAAGKAGSGVVGSNLYVVLTGAVSGGLEADGLRRAYAFEFTGGMNELTLQGRSTVEGGIHINAGALTITNASAYTLHSEISGTGSLEKLGSGTLVLTGGLSNSGGISVSAGTLELAPTAAGTVSSNIAVRSSATLAFGGSAIQTYSGVLSGAGDLVYRGSNVLTLTGNNTYTGATIVEAGRLAVNGTLSGTSGVTVQSGGTLGGSGSVRNVTVESGGVLAPGNSTGTLTIDGPLVLNSGAKVEIEVVSATDFDKLIVNGAVALEGTLQLIVDSGANLAAGEEIRFLEATSVSGAFAAVTSNLALLRPEFSFANGIGKIVMVLNGKNLHEIGVTANQIAVGAALDGLGSGNAIYDTLVPMTVSATRERLDRLSGDIHASIASAQMQQSGLMRGQMLERAAPGQDSGIWGAAFGAGAYQLSDGNAVGLGLVNGGFSLGLDGELGPLRLGTMVSGGSSMFAAGARGAEASSTDLSAGIYGSAELGAVTVTAGASQSWHEINSTRVVGSETLSGAYVARVSQVFGEASMDVALGAVTVSPYAGLAYVRRDGDGFAETGGAAALSVAASTHEALVSVLGLRAEHAFALEDGMQVTLSGGLGWQHVFGDTPSLSQTISGSSAFTVSGVGESRDRLTFDAGLGVELAPNMQLGLSYQGQFSASGFAQTVRAGVSARF